MTSDLGINMRRRGINSSALVVLTLLWGVAGHAQAREHLLPPSPAERAALEKKLDPALMPAGASHRHIDPKQVFKLVGPQGTELTLAPVDFVVPRSNMIEPRFTCGVYVVPAQGAAYFLDFISDDDADLGIQCWAILLVRLVRHEGEPADIVVVGSASVTTHSWNQDYVLHRGKDGIYSVSANYDNAP